MKKKLSLILVVSLSIFLFSSQTIFANENIYGESANIIEIDINDSFYEVVSEDEVILDYMKKEDVDRDTAIKELGITDNKLSACSYQWRHYTSKKKLIEKKGLSGVSLTLSPYVQVKNCDGYNTISKISTAQPGHAFYGFFAYSAHLTTAGAIKASNIRIQVHASGYVKPTIGSKRYWNYDDCVYVESGVGCF